MSDISRFVLTIVVVSGIARAETNEPPVSSLDVYLHPQTLAALPDGRKVHFFCMGEGTPTAILDAGWGSWSTSWRAFQPKLAQFTRVCAFDRPGYGFSDPGPLPRDTAATVADLHAGLKAAALAPPYILVGHSLAGFDARLYAYDYADEVAGLLLIDPPTEKIYQRDRQPDEDLDSVRKCIEIAKTRGLVVDGKDGCLDSPSSDWSKEMQAHQIDVVSKVSYWETELSEDLTMVGSSADEVAAARHKLGNLPLILLQADSSPDDERSKELRGQARDSALGQYRIVKGARHYIHVDKPDIVIAAFREIIDSVRAQHLASVARIRRLDTELIFPAEGTPYGKARTELLRQGALIAPPRSVGRKPKPDKEFRELDCTFGHDESFDGDVCRALFLIRKSNGWRAYIVVYVDKTEKTVLEARYPMPVEGLLSLPPPFSSDVPAVRGSYLKARKTLLDLGFRPARSRGDGSQRICIDNKFKKCVAVEEANCAGDIPVCVAFWESKGGRALKLTLLGEIDPRIEYMEWISDGELRDFEGGN